MTTIYEAVEPNGEAIYYETKASAIAYVRIVGGEVFRCRVAKMPSRVLMCRLLNHEGGYFDERELVYRNT